MHELKPKLFSVMKTYSKDQLVKDIISGIIVAIIALPLSIALSIASGVSPEKGLYTAIIAGFCISLFGGSRVQIGGPTAAFVVIIYGIIEQYGINGLIVATIMAGIFMIIFGLCRAGNLIKFIPYTITTGFTAGIAVTIAIGQIKDFMGIDMGALPSDFVEKVIALAKNIGNLNWIALGIGVLALVIQIVWPKLMGLLPEKLKYIKAIPGSLIAIIIATVLVNCLNLPVATIGSLNYDLSAKFPTISIPEIKLGMIKDLISPAFTIAILASIESLLSAVVADGMIGSKHRSNAELIGQGIGNILAGLFGGIPATGAIARTAANIKNGGRTPIAGMVHSIVLLVILLLLMPYASWIPMPVLASILIMVAYNMSGIANCIRLCKKAPKSDILVFILTFVLTVFFDLVVAIEISMIVAAALFMKRMADTTDIRIWKDIQPEEENDIDNIRMKQVPSNTLVYEICGPMFFGMTDKFMELTRNKGKDVMIIRMRSVPSIDASALHSLYDILDNCKKNKITLIFSHVNEQPMKMMQKAKFDEEVGLENFCANIDEAIKRAENITKFEK